MSKKPPEKYPVLPFRKLKFRDLKEAMRHGVYSRPAGKSAETLAMEAGLDRLSDLSRYISDNPEDPRGKFLDIFLPLLVAMGDKGVEILDYMGEYVRAAQECSIEDDKARASRFISENGPAMLEALKVLVKK